MGGFIEKIAEINAEEKVAQEEADSKLRDHFAGLAMHAFACRGISGGDAVVAINAYRLADAMMVERAK